MKDEYAKRVALKVYSRVPAQKETVLTPKKQKKYWCYTSKIKSNIFELQKQIEVAESMLSAAQLGLSRSLEKDIEYDPFCSNPYPLIALPPKEYCSVSSMLEKKKRQCLAPILKTGCNLSLDELVELENQVLDKAATPLVCMELTNAALDKATTTGDIVGSMAQSVLLSFNGKKGRLADIGVSLLAYARFEGCMGNIDYDCNPRTPAPPDCSAWEENQSTKAVWIGQENEAKDLLIQYKSEVSVLSKRREVQVY